MNNKVLARIATMAGVAGLGIALNGTPALAQQEFGSPELIAAAKAEGKLVYYTANFAEVEQQVIKAFNKRFPEIKVEMVRAPGGQLITRVKTEAAAGKLIADVVDHSDRALMADLIDMFQDYAPPNAADYNPDAQISPKLWPRVTLVVDRLQQRTGKGPAEDLDGSDQARIRPDDRAGVRPVRRHHLDPHHVRA
ncbi:MAG TPA: extracellular solute-binding protein, partial [Bradyrhizobium sp.]|nr:extracellular solute-binding protein [Bradyrhizobium sp.]